MTRKPTKPVSAKLVIHGGAGSLEGNIRKKEAFSTALYSIISATWDVLNQKGAREAVLCAVRMMEDNPIFNAGTGSRIQSDGIIRMSASLMDSSTNIFSGIINVEDVQHPIDAAERLSHGKDHVLAGEPTAQFVSDEGFSYSDPTTEDRIDEFLRRQKGSSGTVGAVALDANGIIVAGTSTGGMGNEIPGRVSDTPTVAGNFANHAAGVSATGKGEDTVNLAAAARIVSNVESGIPLETAVNDLMEQATLLNYKFGVISLDCFGNIIVSKTTDDIFYASHDGESITTFTHNP